MNTEQRVSIRRKVPLNILVNHDLGYSKSWKLSNLSLSGALIEMDKGKFTPGMPIEAVLMLAGNTDKDNYRLPAEVVRVSKSGVAVRFRNYDNLAYTALVNLLYSA